MSPGWGYLVQAIVSIESSYVLNWKYTWKESDAGFWQSFGRFNLSRCLTVPANQVVFVGLVWAGMQYLLANVVTTVIFMIVNYIIGHLWAFNTKPAAASDLDRAPHGETLFASLPAPKVSVVIPVKNSQKTIRDCVMSLLEQDYRGSVEVVLVGDIGDKTWTAIPDLIATGRVKTVECSVESKGRDANAKRNIGLASATGEVLALTDSDMELDADWVTKGIEMLNRGYSCVAGPMRSTANTFWSRYIDRNPLLNKTPRMSPSYVLQHANFGSRGYKPPVTANVFFTRDVINVAGDLNQNFTNSYEDYEFFERVCRSGFDILCSDELVGGHSHRESFKQLMRDYRRAGKGCADFIHEHPASNLSKQRKQQLYGIGILAVLAVAVISLTALNVYIGLIGAAVAIVAYATAGLFCVLRTGLFAAFAYPAVTALLMTSFSLGLIKGLRGMPATAREVLVYRVPEFADGLAD